MQCDESPPPSWQRLKRLLKEMHSKHNIKFFELGRSYGYTTSRSMFKVISLIVSGIFLMSFGLYSLSIAEFALPVVNWTLVGAVTIVASVATLGSAVLVSKLT